QVYFSILSFLMILLRCRDFSQLILMVGWVFSGKSAAGNSILRAEVFHAGDRTVKALRQSGTVAGREVVIVDTPGWWKFFPPTFTHLDLKSEILKGVSLCSPSPNVILLTMPFDTSFTEEQRRITETYLKLLGERVWRHVIVLFTFGNALGDKSIEQHIESEGQPLCKIIEKCGNRYHVLDNTSAADDQVTELLEKMEEMVAGNSCFYLSEEWEEQKKLQPEEQQCEVVFGVELGSNDDPGSESLTSWRILLEKEWSRRQVAMEQAFWRQFHDPLNAGE
uniref:GTPase IMAP family member 8 n=1 Tax=Mola mola TaxID=94237 RepID=A0A3Q4BFA6_MOLML